MATTTQSNPDNEAARRTQQERRTETRRKLMDAVVDLIVEIGFASVTTTQVAARAGVSRGAMQYHFSSRSDLLLAVVDEIWVRMQGPLELQLKAQSTIAERVDAIVDRYWESFSDQLFAAVIDIWLGARGDPKLFDRISENLQSVFAERADHWRAYFAEYDIPADRLMLAHELLRSTIRGLALRRVFGETNKSSITKLEVDAVRGFILAVLEGEI